MHDPFHIRDHYRKTMGRKDLVSFRVTEKESDLHIQAQKNLEKTARKVLTLLRRDIQDYIRAIPTFLTSLVPLPLDPNASPIVQKMLLAGRRAKVGPMAAVAGAIAQGLGEALFHESKEIFVENGGDLFVRSAKDVTVGVYAGDSPFSGKISLLFPCPASGMGICTSSGTLGDSLSLGRADAALVAAEDAAFADAFATAFGNKVQKPEDLERVIEEAASCPEISGILLVKGDRMAARGTMKIIPTGKKQ